MTESGNVIELRKIRKTFDDFVAVDEAHGSKWTWADYRDRAPIPA